MKQMKYAELRDMRAHAEECAALGDTPEWKKLHASLERRAKIVLPLSALRDPVIEPYLLGWKLIGNEFTPMPNKNNCAIAMQGIEPVVEVSCSLFQAMMAATDAGEHRAAVFI